MEEFKFKYIYHSGFLVETQEYILIFDFYKDNLNRDIQYKKEETQKKIIIFSSHSHSDHFNSEILTWDRNRNNIFYILSSDILEKLKLETKQKIEKKENYFFVEKNQKINFEKKIEIYTFGSTDLGVSFLVKVENNIIFHAGDLNWWNWGEEDTLEEAETMANDFKSIVNEIKELVDKIGEIDVAFFPIDPRLGKHQKDGAEYFQKVVSPKKIIPMHYE